MASATLDKIRIKIRRITQSPSASQLTDDEINEYINTFYAYDFPQHLKLNALYSTFTFYTAPNVATYTTNSNPVTAINPLGDFKNRVLSIEPPVYIDGQPAFFSQSVEEFYGIYPKNKSVGSTGLTGDGATVLFSGTLSSYPIESNSVSFTSVAANNVGLNVIDDGSGNLNGDGTGTINYLTGAFSITFTTAPASSEPIMYHTFPYTAGRSTALLFTDLTFTVRPIPDDIYAVQFQYYKQLSDLENDNDAPELNQWWQYIAYGAAKKVFEDRGDFDSIQLNMPEYKNQERLVLRRSLRQHTSQRTPTIYSEGLGMGSGGFGWGSGNNS